MVTGLLVCLQICAHLWGQIGLPRFCGERPKVSLEVGQIFDILGMSLRHPLGHSANITAQEFTSSGTGSAALGHLIVVH